MLKQSCRGILEETLPQIFLDINIILQEAHIHDFWYGPLFGILVVFNVSVAFKGNKYREIKGGDSR